MDIEFEKKIKEEFNKYLEALKEDWTDRLVTGQMGQCALCGKDETELTEHHLIPKRVFKKLHPSLANFLETQKITVCSECHGFFHPENKWINYILAIREIFETEAKNIDDRVEQKIKEKDAEVSKYRQDFNNLGTKLSNKTNECDMLRFNNNELKEQMKRERKKHENDIQDLEKRIDGLNLELNDSGSKNFELGQMVSLFGNTLLFNVDKKSYKEKLKEIMHTEIDNFFKQHGRKPSRESYPLFLRKFENNIPLCEVNDDDTIKNKTKEFFDFSQETMVEVFEEYFKT